MGPNDVIPDEGKLLCNESCLTGTTEWNGTIWSVVECEHLPPFTFDDAIWVMTSSIMIFQMQTGFGLLEAGSVSSKSEVNIMMKNALDVIFGGVTYWAFGFGFSFGENDKSNPFIGVGHYFVHIAPGENLGYVYALFLFQLSFATTSTTIVSGCMVERTKLISYNVFSLFMTFIYTVPAHWMWGSNGFLLELGVQDIAGCGPVHLVGGITGLVATMLIGPRQGAFDSDKRQPAPAPLKCILGTFMLWWGWLRFNSGSVFVVSDEGQWKYAVSAGVNTIIASMGGGITSVVCSLLMCKFWNEARPFPYDCGCIVNGILGSLVSITAACTFVQPWESFIIGAIGVLLTIGAEEFTGRFKIDDPVGVIPVHTVCGMWGLIAVGLFVSPRESLIEGQGGLFKTGQFYMLGVQTLSVVCIGAWTAFFAFLFLKCIDLTIGLRLHAEHERLGADIVEHGVPEIHAESEVAINAVLSLTDLAEIIADSEIKAKVNTFFQDFFSSILRNELYMTISYQSYGVLGLEIHNRELHWKKSLHQGDSRKSHGIGDDSEDKPWFSCCQDGSDDGPGHHTHAGTKSSKSTKSLVVRSSVVRVGPTGTELQIEENGHMVTKVIPYQNSGRRASDGLEAGVCAMVY